MSGARMIFNARYFHIAQPGENLSKHALHSSAASGLINYIATRESVVHNFTPEYEISNATDLQRAKIEELWEDEPELRDLKEFKDYKSDSTAANATRFIGRASRVIAGIDTGEENISDEQNATDKQKERIQEFIAAAPDLKESMEYADFLENPSFKNASEFLSNAFENSMGAVVNSETLQHMVNYMATRPGVVSSQEHGLFSADKITDLEAYKKEVSSHTGNIYSTVLSLRRDDADSLGFNTQEPWKDVVNSKLDVIAENARIPVSDLRWCAAMHNTGHHPHIHLMFWSENPSTQNFLSKKGIEKIKSSFAHEIFRGEFEQLYEQQKTLTKDIKLEAEKIFESLASNVEVYSQSPELTNKLAQLSENLNELKGKHQYKYLPKSAKQLVNEITDGLGEIPEIKKLHQLYEEENNKILSFYKTGDNIPRRKLSEVKSGDNLYFVKNLVIRAAEELDISAPRISEFESEISSEQNKEIDRIELLYYVHDLKMQSDEGNKYAAEKLGDFYLEGVENVLEPDEDLAAMWYGIAANPYDEYFSAISAVKLSELLVKSSDPNEVNQGHEFANQAALELMSELSDSPNIQDIKDFYSGEYSFSDLDKDFYKSLEIKKDSFENGERLFYLGKIFTENHEYNSDFLNGKSIGLKQNLETAKSFFKLSFEAGYKDAAYEFSMLEKRPLNMMSHLVNGAVAGSEKCAREAARRLETGENGYTDLEMSEKLYREADKLKKESLNKKPTENKHNNDEMKKARELYGEAKNLEKDPNQKAEAFRLFKESADFGYSWAQYKTAQYIYKGITDLDREEAQNYFKLARESFQKEEKNPKYKNAWRDYVIGGMYQKGLGTAADEDMAQQYYSKALAGFLSDDKKMPWLEYIVGRMYQYGLGTEINLEESFLHLKEAANMGHARAMYDTASNLMNGKGTQADSAQAQKYYASALSAFISQNKKEPDEWQEYTIARMFAGGLGTEINPQKAFEYYKLSADSGHTQAAYEAAHCFHKGIGTVADPEKAHEYYKKAFDGFILEQKNSPNPQTEYKLFTMYREGLGIEKNMEKAMEYLIKVADSGNGRAQYNAARYLSAGEDVQQNIELASEYYAKALINLTKENELHPDVWIQKTLAAMHEKGLGTQIDPQKAFEYHKQAADGGDSYSAYKTAEYISSVSGFKKDDVIAQQYYSKALAGFTAQNNEKPEHWLQLKLAAMHEKGLGTQIHPQKAFEYHKQAADSGNSYAAYKSAEALRTGNGVSLNEMLSQRYYKKAFDGFMAEERKTPSSQTEFMLGRMFEKGFGTEQDKNQAKQWYMAAAEKGSEYAKEALERMENMENMQQQSAAQSFLMSLLQMTASKMRDENIRQYQRNRGIDRKERRKIMEKKHEMGMHEDWEQSM